ncbi:MAG: dTMP kinase [Thermodesulfobacteriota bacterium]
MGRFVTFEGCEGCGKTTQIGLASSWLKERGIAVIETAEPGGTTLGAMIRNLLLNRSTCAIGAEAELLLFAAARAQHVRETIGPALESGHWVLCDRFTDATIVYQGFGRGIDTGFIRTLNTFSTSSLVPEMTLLFDLPVTTGLERAEKRASVGPPERAEDRFEREDHAFHARIREGYLTLAAGEPGRFRIIDGAADVGSVHREICRHLAELF